MLLLVLYHAVSGRGRADRQTISQLLRGQVAKQGLGRFLRPTLVSMLGWRLDVPRHPFQNKTLGHTVLEQGFASSSHTCPFSWSNNLTDLPRLIWARERGH